MGPRSWVIVDKVTGKAVFETFCRDTVDTVERKHSARYSAVPIVEWLGKINAT